MDERRKQVVLCFAEHNMNSAETARASYVSNSVMSYHLDKVKEQTGLDPRRFYDLVKLVELAREEERNGMESD